jgi:hypothetical protein
MSLKIENSRRDDESRPVCVGRKGRQAILYLKLTKRNTLAPSTLG